jgi:hypothetical protein
MKTLSIYVVLVALLFKKATAVALPEQQFHVMKNTEFGPVYSNVSPNRRRDFVDSTFSPADENALGINYSNIAPSATKRSEAYIPLEASEVMAFVEEQYVFLRIKCGSMCADNVCVVSGLNKALEKRADWKTCVSRPRMRYIQVLYSRKTS